MTLEVICLLPHLWEYVVVAILYNDFYSADNGNIMRS